MEVKIESKIFIFEDRNGVLQIQELSRSFKGTTELSKDKGFVFLEGLKLALSGYLRLGLLKNIEFEKGFMKFQIRRNKRGTFLVISLHNEKRKKPEIFVCIPRGVNGRGWRLVAKCIGLFLKDKLLPESGCENGDRVVCCEENAIGCEELRKFFVLVLANASEEDWSSLKDNVGAFLNKKLEGYFTRVANQCAVIQLNGSEDTQALL